MNFYLARIPGTNSLKPEKGVGASFDRNDSNHYSPTMIKVKGYNVTEASLSNVTCPCVNKLFFFKLTV